MISVALMQALYLRTRKMLAERTSGRISKVSGFLTHWCRGVPPLEGVF